MNCPKCHHGMLENIGYVELKGGPLELKTVQYVPDNVPAIMVYLCSREPCDHVNLRAAPESLSLAKSNVRDLVHAHRKLP